MKILTAIIVLSLCFGTTAIAQDEDLSDNETCLMCHEDTERASPSDPNRPQVHNPDGGFFVEDHEMFSCNECHTYVTNLEHEDTEEDIVTYNEVDCLECHDAVPSKK